MSSEVSVRARGLQKRYNLFDTSFGALAGLMTGREARKQHWALRDIDLDAKAGDFIGIVGRNGAGKSTLLQIIAGILTPDSGSLTVNGRVAALLELGTGFNPDFTGWENVELSASLYGLSAKQIGERRHAISEFAGLGDFMDRPTREYSSGMVAKLAFSVCLHVDAEIVIVDELLGVGDFRFRQRATRRLLKFAEDGIVFFVSHSEAMVLSLCNRAIFIDDGRKMLDGSTKSVFRAYQRAISKLGGEGDTFSESGDVSEDGCGAADLVPPNTSSEISSVLPGQDFYQRMPPIRSVGPSIIESVELSAKEVTEGFVFEGGERLTVTIRTQEIDLSDVYVAILLKDAFGQTICARDSLDLTVGGPIAEKLRVLGAEFEFPMPYLPSGDYAFDVAIGRGGNADGWIDFREAAVEFSIVSRHVSEGLANIVMDDVTIVPADAT